MENWCINRLRNVGGILTRAATPRVCRETNLIVDNDMDCAANLVVRQISHLQSFKHNTLTCHGSVTVHNDGHDFLAVIFGATQEVLLSADATHNYRVNSFQVRRIRHQSHSDFSTIIVGTSVSSSQMVFDVTTGVR